MGRFREPHLQQVTTTPASLSWLSPCIVLPFASQVSATVLRPLWHHSAQPRCAFRTSTSVDKSQRLVIRLSTGSCLHCQSCSSTGLLCFAFGRSLAPHGAQPLEPRIDARALLASHFLVFAARVPLNIVRRCSALVLVRWDVKRVSFSGRLWLAGVEPAKTEVPRGIPSRHSLQAVPFATSFSTYPWQNARNTSPT